ncbi:MAG: MBL fold metallo-hydrolase [Mogibacterium sp.]|nr:MBL fold metallo-hydrolase [Mogibacterium sp.]
MEIVSVGSSSSGNSYIINTAGSVIILDVGLPAKRILGALEGLGIEPEEVDAVLITHEHTDHVKSVRAISRKCCNAVFYASRGTVESTPNFAYVPENRVHIVHAGDHFGLPPFSEEKDNETSSVDIENHYNINAGKGLLATNDSQEWSPTSVKTGNGNALYRTSKAIVEVGRSDFFYSASMVAETTELYYGKIGKEVSISVFALSHDAAEPVGFSIEAGGEKLSVVTDTGIITEEIFDAIKDSDMLVFEANHDEQMLLFGEYPYHVKMRIKSEYGHLSNEYAGDVLAEIIRYRSAALSEMKHLRPQNVINGKVNDTDCEPAGESRYSLEKVNPVHILLAHLSFHNNAPFFARQAVEEALQKAGFTNGKDYMLEVASRDELTVLST